MKNTTITPKAHYPVERIQPADAFYPQMILHQMKYKPFAENAEMISTMYKTKFLTLRSGTRPINTLNGFSAIITNNPLVIQEFKTYTKQVKKPNARLIIESNLNSLYFFIICKIRFFFLFLF
jgi:hypothetical protein